MPAEPRISVVLPVHDGELHVGEAIESVLGQGRDDLELVVVDDGSTDGTAGIVGGYGPPVRVVTLGGVGAGEARNAGIEESRGELLAFLDHDDVWEPDKLAVQLAVLEDPAIDAVFGHLRYFVSPEVDAETAARIVCPPEPRAALLPGTLLTRREAFVRIGRFAAWSQASEFLEWLLRADELGLRRVTVPEVVLRRRLHATNFHVLNPRAREDYARTLKSALDRRRAAEAG
jgi:glycosyltransferase involved in cell wall biosynthesis